jgi:large subunit ribosomal protein L17
MHRHGYKGRKFGREKDQRRMLIKSLANSLVLNESIETTVSKAKEILPYVERLITKAKRGDLHSRRQVISGLMTLEAAHKLVDEIAPKLSSRVSGHLRIKRTNARRGDNSQLAMISFVDDLTVTPKKVADKSTNLTKSKPASVKPSPEKKIIKKVAK